MIVTKSNLNTEEVVSTIEQKISEKLEDVGQFLEQDVKVVTPVRTGRLKSSMTHITDLTDLSTSIGSDLYYSKYVESRKPFLEPAVTGDIPKILNTFKDII